MKRAACAHASAYAVRAEIRGEMQEAAIVCRGCGAMQWCPVMLGSWTDWTKPLRKQDNVFPEGAALRLLDGPADAELLRGAVVRAWEEENARRESETRERVRERLPLART